MEREKQVMSTPEKLASVLFLSFGLEAISRALFFIVFSTEASNDSPFYMELSSLMPLWAWGSILFIFGLCMCLACLSIPKRLVNVRFDLLVIVGSFGTSAYYFMMTVVSMVDSINYLTPTNFLIKTSCLALCGIVGVMSYARKR